MSDWKAIPDNESGECYYYNNKTGETTWDKPEGFTDSPAPATAAVPAAQPAAVPSTPSKWTAVKDGDSGEFYYYNTATGETTWDKPEGYEDGAAAKPASAPAATPKTATSPSPWKAVYDASSSSYYFHNATTGETTWDRPEGVPDPATSSTPQAASTDASSPPPPTSPAPAPAPAASTHATAYSAARMLSPASKTAWATVLARAKSDAAAAGSGGPGGFEGLRAFAESMKQKREKRAAATGPEGAAGATSPDSATSPTATAASPASRGADLVEFLKVEVQNPTKCPMERYAEEYFQLNRKGIFGKKTTVDKDIIKTALKKMASSDLGKQAQQCFRNITGFMGDRSTSKEDGGHAEKLLKQALTAPEELRDEVYCQLIKQTTRNPNPESLVKGWQLMGICTGAFPPSKTFEPYLLSYCFDHMSVAGEVGKYASYCAGRVKMAGSLGPRRETPTPMEIDACKHRLPVVLRVYTMDGAYESMPVVSWTTAGMMNKMMAHRFGVKNPEAFSLYEITPEGEERYLDKDERLLDMVSYWQRLYEEEKKLPENKSYRVAYKTHMYFDPEPSDEAAERLMYIQAVYDVVSSRYPCNEEDCKTLAGLQLQFELGTKRLPDLETKLKRFLPAKMCTDERKSELGAEIQKRHKTHSGKSSSEIQRAYLRHVKAWKIYGSQFFHVEPQMSADLPDEVFLAINPRGVLLINPDTKDVLSEYPYSEIPTWGHSGTSFVLHVGNLLKQNKLYFQTEQGKEINDLVRAYVNHLCA